MILKRIEIYGFKSFGKKIEIDFNDAITGIVGPNGSGKSNIVDAIRWVLGEQRVKSLRGSKMEDVIFSGTQEKKPLGYAQVSLILDNERKLFPMEYEEINVTRRLFRSGESEYYLNKTLCRLRDIQELFMDTGLGREGYSIVGQGQIESVINVSPYERKLLIEEAAGIVKYKVRKLEAEKKLEKAQNNLYRITDIIAELQNRLPALKKQAEKAEKFIEYKNELKTIEVNIFVHRMDRLNVQASKAYLDKSALEESLKQIDDEMVFLDGRYQTLKSEVGTYDAKIAEVNENIRTLITNFENSKTEISVARSKVDIHENTILDTQNEINELNQSLERLHSSKRELVSSLTSAGDESRNKKQIYEDSKMMAEQIGEKYRDGDKYIQNLREEIGRVEKNIDAHQIKANELAASVQNSDYIIESLLNESASLKEEYERLQSEADTLSLQPQPGLKEAEMDFVDAERNKNLRNHEYETYKEEVRSLIIKLQTDESRFKLLSGYENSMQGYRFGVRKLAEQKKNDPVLQKNLFGAVGELIRTDVKYTEAVTKALGGAMEYLVVENEDTASYCIKLLKMRNWGRITFLPKNIVKGSRGRSDDDQRVLSMKGCIGYASDLVNCEKEFMPIIENLLGRTFVIDTIENAVEIAGKTSHRHKLVTLDGEVLMPGGAMVGGKSKDDDEGVLSRRNEIEILKKQLLLDRTAYENKLLEKSGYDAGISQADAILKQAQQKLNELKNKQGAHHQLILGKKERADEAKQKIASLNNQIDQKKLKRLEDEKNMAALGEQLSILQRSLEEIRSETTKTSSGAYKEDYLEAVRRTGETEIEKIKAEEAVSQLEERLSNIEEKISEIAEAKQQKENLIEKLQADITTLREQIEYYTEIDKDYDLTRKELDQMYKNLTTQKSKSDTEYVTVNDKIILLNKERTAVSEQLSKTELSLNRAEVEMEHLQKDMMEDYSLSYTAALEFKTEITDLNRNIAYVAEIKDKIRRLGNINVDALEEFKDVKERFETMSTQKDDLVTAKEELVKVIKDLSSSMVHQFMQQFHLIQKEFNDVFCRLFNGGEARLVLTDPDNIMESGIDIIAQPPKTKLKNIAALSGGEKSMTAVSLIFGILRIKPSPFCVLDEIDAALDDANANRFCDYLLSIRNSNQFVIITHKKKTMEIADSLYGVAMGKDGITQTYSVKMSDIGEMGAVHA